MRTIMTILMLLLTLYKSILFTNIYYCIIFIPYAERKKNKFKIEAVKNKQAFKNQNTFT